MDGGLRKTRRWVVHDPPFVTHPPSFALRMGGPPTAGRRESCRGLSAPVCACLRPHRQMPIRTGRCRFAQADADSHRQMPIRTGRCRFAQADADSHRQMPIRTGRPVCVPHRQARRSKTLRTCPGRPALLVCRHEYGCGNKTRLRAAARTPEGPACPLGADASERPLERRRIDGPRLRRGTRAGPAGGSRCQT